MIIDRIEFEYNIKSKLDRHDLDDRSKTQYQNLSFKLKFNTISNSYQHSQKLNQILIDFNQIVHRFRST